MLHKCRKSLALVLLTFIACLFFASPGQASVKTYHQHEPALKDYHMRNYSVVNNDNVTRHLYHYQLVAGRHAPHFLKSIDGHPKATFKTLHFLPINWLSPQSLVVTPNQHYAYVMYNESYKYGPGHTRVVRYDLWKLGQRNLEPMKKHPSIKKAIKIGPAFKGGHGQSLSYNPKMKQLWFLGNDGGAQNKTSVQQLNQNKLTPKRKIDFQFGSKGTPISENLAFDKHGNAYTFTRTLSSTAPQGSIKLYKGKITNNSVHFRLIDQGIRHAPGIIPQAMAYNPRNERLYLVSDGAIMSIPSNKLGHLKKHDVKNMKFSGHREFEGLSFDRNGKAFLLLNRIGEIMKSQTKF